MQDGSATPSEAFWEALSRQSCDNQYYGLVRPGEQMYPAPRVCCDDPGIMDRR